MQIILKGEKSCTSVKKKKKWGSWSEDYVPPASLEEQQGRGNSNEVVPARLREDKLDDKVEILSQL